MTQAAEKVDGEPSALAGDSMRSVVVSELGRANARATERHPTSRNPTAVLTRVGAGRLQRTPAWSAGDGGCSVMGLRHVRVGRRNAGPLRMPRQFLQLDDPSGGPRPYNPWAVAFVA